MADTDTPKESLNSPRSTQPHASSKTPTAPKKKVKSRSRMDERDDTTIQLDTEFRKHPVQKTCVIPGCKCVEKRGKPPKKHRCPKCHSVYYCCNKLMGDCYHYCPTASPTTRPVLGGGEFSKLDKI